MRGLDRSHSLHYAGPGMPSPLRLCSPLPSATEIVLALGLGSKLGAVTQRWDFPPEAVRLPSSREAPSTLRPTAAAGSTTISYSRTESGLARSLPSILSGLPSFNAVRPVGPVEVPGHEATMFLAQLLLRTRDGTMAALSLSRGTNGRGEPVSLRAAQCANSEGTISGQEIQCQDSIFRRVNLLGQRVFISSPRLGSGSHFWSGLYPPVSRQQQTPRHVSIAGFCRRSRIRHESSRSVACGT